MALWYYSDDYYFTHLGNTEINIKATSASNLEVFVYDHRKPIEETLIAQFKASSPTDAQEQLESVLNRSVNVPQEKQLETLYKKKETTKEINTASSLFFR